MQQLIWLKVFCKKEKKKTKEGVKPLVINFGRVKKANVKRFSVLAVVKKNKRKNIFVVIPEIKKKKKNRTYGLLSDSYKIAINFIG